MDALHRPAGIGKLQRPSNSAGARHARWSRVPESSPPASCRNMRLPCPGDIAARDALARIFWERGKMQSSQLRAFEQIEVTHEMARPRLQPVRSQPAGKPSDLLGPT